MTRDPTTNDIFDRARQEGYQVGFQEGQVAAHSSFLKYQLDHGESSTDALVIQIAKWRPSELIDDHMAAKLRVRFG